MSKIMTELNNLKIKIIHRRLIEDRAKLQLNEMEAMKLRERISKAGLEIRRLKKENGSNTR